MIDIAAAVISEKEKKIKSWPVNANHASQAGHPCTKYLVLYRTHSQDRPMHEVGLQFIFDRGNAIEPIALREIEDAGFRVVEQQRPYEWKELQLTGRIDAKISVNGGLYPLEVKALSPYDFPKLNGVEDFMASGKIWLMKYPAQLMLYMLMEGIDQGVFYIKNGLNWWPKCIWVDLDYDYADGVVRRLEAVNKHVAEGTQPEGINDPGLCPDCDFFHICLPEIRREALAIEDDPELEAQIERWEELKSANAEYKKLDDLLKKKLEGKERAVIGNYLIMGKYTDRKGYTVESSTYWRKTIKRLEV